MKKMVSFRLSPEMIQRVERIARATRIKKTTILEMCIEMDLPRLEERYARELQELEKRGPSSPVKRETLRTSSSPAKMEGKAEDILDVVEKHYPSKPSHRK